MMILPIIEQGHFSDDHYQLIPHGMWISDSARSMGIHIQAGKGSGKSRLMGRVVGWIDFLRGIPQFIFDPDGPTIDNFLDKILRLPQEWQYRLWPRVHYIDMSGKSGRVIPFPIYYRLGGESLFEIAQRPLNVFRKLDPHLQTASIQGWNPLWEVGTKAGMILAGLEMQITEAGNLLKYPFSWSEMLRQVQEKYPETQPAVSFFRELKDVSQSIVQSKTSSFLNKVSLFSLDPFMKAMFGSNTTGINWQQILDKRQTVLLDFRHVYDIERRRFMMLWAFLYFLDFIKHRGAGRHIPIGLIIDELTALFSIQTLTSDVIAVELDNLINVIARNYRVWLTIAHQEQFQLSERMQKTMMTMGTQIFGVTSSRDSALSLARHYYPYDPYMVKKYEPIYMSYLGAPMVVDHRKIEFRIDEQTLINSNQFTDQGRFQFLVRPAAGEGDFRGKLQPISISRIDPGMYPNQKLVARARSYLMQQNGFDIKEQLKEIEGRLPSNRLLSPPRSSKSKNSSEEKTKPSIWK